VQQVFYVSEETI